MAQVDQCEQPSSARVFGRDRIYDCGGQRASEHRRDRVRPELRALNVAEWREEQLNPIRRLRREDENQHRHAPTRARSRERDGEVACVHLSLANAPIDSDDDQCRNAQRDENSHEVEHDRQSLGRLVKRVRQSA